MKKTIRLSLCATVSAAALAALAASAQGTLHDERETRLSDVRQLTFGAENAEAYWSPDGSELVFQSNRAPYECDQIYRMSVSDPAALTLVSTGRGRTTCGYFSADGERVIFSSTHAADAQCPAPPDRSQGYVWPIYDTYQIYSAAPDGSDLVALTDTPAYDAEATVCPVDGSIVFTSTRDGDLDLYRMDADGANVRRLTDAPGYDGGAFFSRDCSMIVWRASRPSGAELEDYRALLAEGLVRPGELEIFVANGDGSEPRQVTHVGGANFAPFFFPDGQRIIFSSNHHDPAGREFDLFAVGVDGDEPGAHHLHARIRRLPDVFAGRTTTRLRLQPQPGPTRGNRRLPGALDREPGRIEGPRRSNPVASVAGSRLHPGPGRWSRGKRR